MSSKSLRKSMFIWNPRNLYSEAKFAQKNVSQKNGFPPQKFQKNITSKNGIYIALSLIVFEIWAILQIHLFPMSSKSAGKSVFAQEKNFRKKNGFPPQKLQKNITSKNGIYIALSLIVFEIWAILQIHLFPMSSKSAGKSVFAQEKKNQAKKWISASKT